MMRNIAFAIVTVACIGASFSVVMWRPESSAAGGFGFLAFLVIVAWGSY